MVRETETEVPMEAGLENKHMVPDELFSLHSSPRAFVNNEDTELAEMEARGWPCVVWGC